MTAAPRHVANISQLQQAFPSPFPAACAPFAACSSCTLPPRAFSAPSGSRARAHTVNERRLMEHERVRDVGWDQGKEDEANDDQGKFTGKWVRVDG